MSGGLAAHRLGGPVYGTFCGATRDSLIARARGDRHGFVDWRRCGLPEGVQKNLALSDPMGRDGIGRLNPSAYGVKPGAVGLGRGVRGYAK